MKKRIMRFSSFVNEQYIFENENFTDDNLEDVRDFYKDGITDVNQISEESGLSPNMVNQIVYKLRKNGDISESEVFDEEEEESGCGCDICNCVGECHCDCCCAENDVDDVNWVFGEDASHISCPMCKNPLTTFDDSVYSDEVEEYVHKGCLETNKS